MNCFLIFSYEILKLKFCLKFFELNRVDLPCNLGPNSLVGSTPKSGLITMILSL